MINKSRIDELLARAERLEDITLQHGPVLTAGLFLLALTMAAAGVFVLIVIEDFNKIEKLGAGAGVLLFGGIAAVYLIKCFFPHMRCIRMTPETLETSGELGLYYHRAPWSRVKDFKVSLGSIYKPKFYAGVSFTITPKGARWPKFKAVAARRYGLAAEDMVKLLETYRATALKDL